MSNETIVWEPPLNLFQVILSDLTLLFDYLVIATGYVNRNPLPDPYAASLGIVQARQEIEPVSDVLVVGGGPKIMALLLSVLG